MNNTETINSLKNAGFQVRIKHFRALVTKENSGPPVRYSGPPVRYRKRDKNVREAMKTANIFVSQRGGGTIVQIQKAGTNHIFQGESDCHANDNFNYKLGTRIALGRAKKELQRHYPTI